jgi:F-box and leucine-rich repeat protein GRR1
LKSLTYLDISHVETITDRTLIAIAENAKDIALINTSWCKLVTDVGINALAAECPNLKELHIRECYRVSDEAIASMKTNKCTVFDY